MASRIEEMAKGYAALDTDLWTPISKDTQELERLAYVAGAKAVLEEARRMAIDEPIRGTTKRRKVVRLIRLEALFTEDHEQR